MELLYIYKPVKNTLILLTAESSFVRILCIVRNLIIRGILINFFSKLPNTKITTICKNLTSLFLLASLSGCTTNEEDGIQVLFAGTWGVYLLVTLLTKFFFRTKPRHNIIVFGLVFFFVLSLFSPFLVKNGRIFYIPDKLLDLLFIGLPIHIVETLLSGPIVALCLSPVIFVYAILYAIILFLISKSLTINKIEIIIFLITIFYFFTVVITYFTKFPAIIIWLWPFATKL